MSLADFTCNNPAPGTALLGCCGGGALAIKLFAAIHPWRGQVRMTGMPSVNYCRRFLRCDRHCSSINDGNPELSGDDTFNIQRLGGLETLTHVGDESACDRYAELVNDPLWNVSGVMTESSLLVFQFDYTAVHTIVPVTVTGTIKLTFSQEYTVEAWWNDLTQLYGLLPPFSAVPYPPSGIVHRFAFYTQDDNVSITAGTVSPRWPCFSPVIAAITGDGTDDRLLAGFSPYSFSDQASIGNHFPMLARSAVLWNQPYCKFRTNVTQPNNCHAIAGWIPEFFHGGGITVPMQGVNVAADQPFDINCDQPIECTTMPAEPEEIILLPEFLGAGAPGVNIATSIAPQSVAVPCVDCNPAP